MQRNKSLIAKENQYLRKIQAKLRGDEASFFSPYLYDVMTNLGSGSVYVLARDQKSQAVSKTLRQYIVAHKDQEPNAVHRAHLEIERLKSLLSKYCVQMSDVLFDNLCVQELADGRIQLMIIDGIGHRDFIKLFDYASWYASIRIETKFKKLALDKLQLLYQEA